MKMSSFRILKVLAVAAAATLILSGCSLSPYKIPFPGGADTGNNPLNIKVEFRDVLDLVPQSGVRVNDVTVGKVTDIELKGWTAVLSLQINRNADLPANAVATIRQTSLLGEKFVSLGPPPSGAIGTMRSGDVIPLSRTGRNPELEEVLASASLLFNGGGLEKTKTVVQELNKTLSGNEGDIRQLLDSANNFLGQLDRNKAGLLTALEKVNNLAVATNKQTSAITGALDNLPGALTVVNQQRDGLVKLLQALNRLGVVGTRVVSQSKVDTLADIRALTPVLRQLAASGDDLAKSVTTLLTFPFTDSTVGGPTVQGAKDYHKGDYFNLNASLDISLEQLGGILGLGASLSKVSGTTGATQSSSASPLTSLASLVGGLVPKSGTGLPSLGGVAPGSTSTPKTGAASTSPTRPTGGSGLPQLCSVLGSCRVAAQSAGNAATSDVGRLLLEPVVAS